MNFQLLKEKLGRGFYVDNLYEMARLCNEKVLENENPTPFFILQKIFSGIADYWDKGPVVVENARLVQNELSQHIKSLINAIENHASAEEIVTLTDKVVSSYKFLFR